MLICCVVKKNLVVKGLLFNASPSEDSYKWEQLSRLRKEMETKSNIYAFRISLITLSLTAHFEAYTSRDTKALAVSDQEIHKVVFT